MALIGLVERYETFTTIEIQKRKSSIKGTQRPLVMQMSITTGDAWSQKHCQLTWSWQKKPDSKSTTPE
jgi:hypothetical protein